MVIKTYNTRAEVQLAGPISLYLEIQLDYAVNTSIRYKPKVDCLVGMRVKINGVWQGVEELRLALYDKGFTAEMLEEIQNQETGDAEYGDGGRQPVLGGA